VKSAPQDKQAVNCLGFFLRGAAAPATAGDGFLIDNVEVSAPLPVTNVTQGTSFGTIQAAIDAANPGDMIELAAGIYSEAPVNVNKAVTIEGPNDGLAGVDPGRGSEATLLNTPLTFTAAAVLDGVEIHQTDNTSDAVLVQAAATVRNSVIRRDGVDAGQSVRGITTAVGTTGFTISGNLISGDDSGGFFSGHKTWNSGIYVNGGSGTFSGNTIENCRTAINLDDFNAGLALNGNVFRTSGTYLAFGGVTPTAGQYSLGSNEFFIDWSDPVTNWLPSAMFNNSNVDPGFRLDVTSSTFGGTATAVLSDVQKFNIEARNFHRGRSGRKGVVDFVANEQVVMPGTTIASAITAAGAGDTVRVGPGSFAESVTVGKDLTLLGAKHGQPYGAPSRGADETELAGGIRVAAPGVIVDGFTITDIHSAANPGGVFVAADGVEVRNNIVSGLTTVGHSGVVTVVGINDLTAIGNSLSDGYRGMFLNPGSGHVISGNEFRNNSAVGIGSDGQSDLEISGNVFADNGLEGFGASAVGTGVVVTQNNFTGNTAAVAHYGGATIDATLNYWGGDGSIGASGPFAPNNVVGGSSPGLVDFSPWYADAARTIEVSLLDDVVIEDGETVVETILFIPPGQTVTVEEGGTLQVDQIEVAPGGELLVEGGELVIGPGSTISGSFLIFNSFGSLNINGDTTFTIGQSLALISDIHVAAGATVTVNGGGELIFDGCVVDSQTPGSTYDIEVEDDGLLTIARCVVSDAVIDIDSDASMVGPNLRSRVYDSRFTDSDIEASADAFVYHNLFDAATDAASDTDGTAAFDPIDGWGNVTSAGDLENPYFLAFAPSPEPGRTLDADGNLFVQSGDDVVMELEVGDLSPNTIIAAEALLGYNADLLGVAAVSDAVAAASGWQVIENSGSTSGALGLADSALGLDFVGPGDDGISGPATIGSVTYEALDEGVTLGFFRVQTDGQFNPDGSFVKDTRLTASSGGIPSFLTAFTSNTGEVVIDDQAPVISVASATATQEQASFGPIDVFDPAERVFRTADPVVFTFAATDAGLAGLDADDAINDLALTADNGTTLLDDADYAVTAVESLGVVTYTVTMAIPATATTGTYAVEATVLDRSGNLSATASLGSFIIANEVAVAVELEGFTGATRDVTFVATDGGGAVLATYPDVTLSFTGGVASVNLPDVPGATAALSAKTAWHLRSKVAVTLDGVGLGSADLTGADELPAGDLTGDNVVNTLDYGVLRFHWTTADPTADIDGDGTVAVGDYLLMRGNFYTAGEQP